MANIFNIGTSALKTYQQALTVTGNNIANANTEGYTRERVNLGTLDSNFVSTGYIGSGVYADSIERVANQFYNKQLRSDNSNHEQADIYLKRISQVDGLLSNNATGLADSMQKFFASIQSASKDPADISARQMVVTRAQGLAQRFETVHAYLNEQNTITNQQIGNLSSEINNISKGLAKINEQLNKSVQARNGDLPHDLLDEKDKLLKKLSGLVAINVVEESARQTNVFLENGQPLVVNTKASTLVASANEKNPEKMDVYLKDANRLLNISKQIHGGQLGGLLNYQKSVIDKSLQELGLLALGVQDSMNTLNRMGVDLNGENGENIFRDINHEALKAGRVFKHKNNAMPDDRQLDIDIKDVSQLKASDYTLQFNGPGNFNFRVVRESDGETVRQGSLAGVFPARITVDGFQINMNSGSFQEGDEFLIRPVKNASRHVKVSISNPESLAFAQAVTAAANAGNSGKASISQPAMLGVTNGQGEILPNFQQTGKLAPPLIIKFTSSTTYDVLDNSDPANPVDLQPPRRSLSYTPGVINTLFSADINQTSVHTSTAVVTNVNAGATNGTPAETLTVTSTDPNTHIPVTQTVALAANDSANVVATKISQLDGVKARADTQLGLQVSDVGGTAMELMVNGIAITDASAPSPITVDYLRDQINGNANLSGLGISALSDGNTLSIRSIKGDDINIAVTGGDAADTVSVTRVNGQAATGSSTITTGNNATVGGIVMVDMADNGRLKTSQPANTGRFSDPPPLSVGSYLGYQVKISGAPVPGDEFSLNFNANGASDNRNALAMVNVQTKKLLKDDSVTLSETYAQLIETVGADTNRARVNLDASKTMLKQSQAQRDALSGVNLDEEASKLIQYQQAYQAAAQIISTSRDAFNSLLQAVG